MPLARYFFFFGGMLLALLFISDAYLPKLPIANKANPDLPVIRIHSAQKWPERVVYDTSLPTTAPAQIANMEVKVPALATVANVLAKAEVREAFAQVQPSDTNQLQPSDPKKLEPTLQRKRKMAKSHASPVVRLAQRPQFGFFGKSIW